MCIPAAFAQSSTWGEFSFLLIVYMYINMCVWTQDSELYLWSTAGSVHLLGEFIDISSVADRLSCALCVLVWGGGMIPPNGVDCECVRDPAALQLM